jgi:branched-chain amino acid transport system permease protein
VNATLIGQVLLNGFVLSAIYVLIALGFTLIFGIMRIVNFAHGEFAMLGGFTMLYLYGTLKLNVFVALLLSGLIVAIGSLVFERLIYRRVRQRQVRVNMNTELRGMIATLGLSLALQYLAVIVWDAHPRSTPSAFPQVLSLGNVYMPLDRLVMVAISLVTLLVFYGFMRFTDTGVAIRAAAQDLEISETQGVNTERIYVIAFLIGIFMAALAGALWGQVFNLSPFIGETPLLKAFVIMILGGMGSIPGAALGSLILGMMESLIGTFYGATTAQFVFFAAIMLLLVVRPHGLLGTPEI